MTKRNRTERTRIHSIIYVIHWHSNDITQDRSFRNTQMTQSIKEYKDSDHDKHDCSAKRQI